MRRLTQYLLSWRGNSRGPRLRRSTPPWSSRSQLALESLEDRTLLSGASIIQSNFNGTPIAPGSTLWFNSVLKASGLGSSPVTIRMTDASIDFAVNGSTISIPVPDAAITFSPTATSAATTFDPGSNTWNTTVPTKLGGNTFLAGVAYQAPAGLPGGINPVTWQGQFQADTTGVTVNWQWATAVYTSFSTDYAALNVKPVDDNHVSVYQNSDHAGTPEAFRAFVVGGARGGGGSNWTGSYSATGSATPGYVPPGSSLSGFVTNISNGSGLSGIQVTLTGADNLNQTVHLVTTTSATGAYSFTGLLPGTYTITETPPTTYVDSSNTVGSLGGTASTDQFTGIVVNSGVNGVNYNFGDVFNAFGGS